MTVYYSLGTPFLKSATLSRLPMTCTSIARFQVSALASVTSQLNFPLDLSSAIVMGEIDREALCGVALTLNRFWNSALIGPVAEPSFPMLTIPIVLNFMTKPRPKPTDTLKFQFSATEDPSLTSTMAGGNSSAVSDVVLTGEGSNHVTLPPSEGEYFRSQLNYNNLCFRFYKNKNSFPLILN